MDFEIGRGDHATLSFGLWNFLVLFLKNSQ